MNKRPRSVKRSKGNTTCKRAREQFLRHIERNNVVRKIYLCYSVESDVSATNTTFALLNELKAYRKDL